MAAQIAIVAEDRLTQAVLHKCVAEYLPHFQIIRSEIKGGRGNVQREIGAYAKLARSIPVLIGMDLDHDDCAPAVLTRWRVIDLLSDQFMVRFAVREIESWVLADRKRFARFVGGSSDDVSDAPDMLEDPKGSLLSLARFSADEELRRDLVPRNFDKQYPRIGPAYNPRMCDFVDKKWRPHVAIRRSESLARAIRALCRLK